MTSVPSHAGKLIVCQGNLNVTDSVTVVSMPSAAANDISLSDSTDDSEPETESESGLWDT